MIRLKNVKLFVLYTILLMVLVTIFTCSEDETIIQLPLDNNLITNGSFESNGSPSLQGWQSSTSDTAYINFSNDVPAGGGLFSVRLFHNTPFPCAIEYHLVPPVGTHIYEFSTWAKRINQRNYLVGGGASLLLKTGGVEIFRKSFAVTDTIWTYKSIIDTLITSSTDTVVIQLRGVISQTSIGYTYYDICRFEKLD